MRIVETTGFKRGIDGTILREYTPDAEVTPDMAREPGNSGPTPIMGNLKKPFFSFTKECLFNRSDRGLYVRFRKEHMGISADPANEIAIRYNTDRPGEDAVKAFRERISLPEIHG